MQQSRIIKWLINLALFSILLLVSLLFVFRQRVSELSQGKKAPEWTTVADRDKLGREFVWTAQFSKTLPADGQFRLRLTGQTRLLDVICADTELRVQEQTGSQTEQASGRSAWPGALAVGTRLQVTKMLDSVGVFFNGQRVMLIPCPLEEWQGGVWDVTGMTESPAALSYQKLDTFLFTDDFMHGEGELGEWKPVSGTWTVYAIKNPIRSANPFSFWGRGDAVARTGYWFWRNYEFTATVHPLPDSGFGLFFCQLDDNTRYELKWHPATGDVKATLRLGKVVAGQTTVLAEKPELFLPTLWLQLRIVQIEGDIAVYADDRLIFRLTDPTPLLGGAIGLWTSGERGAVFDDVVVKPVDAIRVDLTEGKASDSPLLQDVTTDTCSPENSAEKRRRLTFVGLVRQNTQVSVNTKGLSGPGAWIELRARQSGAGDYVGFRVSSGNAGPVTELVLHRSGRTTVLDHASLPKLPDRTRLSLHVRDDETWGCLDGTMACFASGVDLMSKGVCSVETAVNGPVTAEQLGQEPELPLPTIENRVETFTHETSMQGWSSPRLESAPERCGDTLQYWHRSDFWQDFAVSIDRQPLTDQELTREWGLALRAADQSGDPLAAQAVVVRQDNTEQVRFTFGGEPAQTKLLPLTAGLTSLSLEKRYNRLLVRVNGTVVANQPLPTALQGLCHIGRIGEGSSDAWAQALTVRAAGVKTYSFKEAPADWIPVAGTWEITNRWQCDPRWSFFAGYQNPGVACNWNKRRHGRNVTLEFFAGPKMDAERGKKYEYAADINAVICGDGHDITNGYSFMLGGWDDTGSYIVRGGKVLAENKAIIIPRMSSTHHRWFHVRIRRQDGLLTWWIDGTKVSSVTDPTPLTGDRFALWTWNNGIMVAQVRVSTDIDFSAAATPVEAPCTPRTPYDSGTNTPPRSSGRGLRTTSVAARAPALAGHARDVVRCLVLPLGAACLLAGAGCSRRATIVVETEPAGAAVWVGPQLAGPSPQTVTLRKGDSVQVRASHPSCIDASITLDPRNLPPDRRVLLRLAPKPTFSIQCVAKPCEAEVFLDGEYRGRTPLRLSGLEQSTVELIFRAPDREQVRRTVTLDRQNANAVVEVVLRSLAEPYYRQEIKDSPEVMANYVDLAHHLVLERRYPDAMSVLADGIRLALKNPDVQDAGRLWSEIEKIITRQYVFGDFQDLKPVRALLRDMLAGLLAESPKGDPQLFVQYAVVLDELDQRDESVRVMKEAWKKFPDNQALTQLAERKRLPLR